MRRDAKPKLKVIDGSVVGSGDAPPNDANDINGIESGEAEMVSAIDDVS
jgi:hypothetical protein